ncbi:MAG: hypothetical protein HUK23_07250 [Sphaerochaetaceae bacterium]|nr:hypothetical protein [Sphaerochaetaceae bacterium]
MKRFILVSFIIASMLSCFAATTANTDINVKAYKAESIPNNSKDVIFNVSVKSFTGASFSTVKSTIDISKDIIDTYTINDAFSIEIQTNYNPIAIDIEFTPFVNKEDKTKKVGVNYGFTADTIAELEGLTAVSAVNHKQTKYFFGYMFEVSLTNNVTTINVPATSDAITTTLTMAVSKMKSKRNSKDSSWTSYSSPEDSSEKPQASSNNAILPSLNNTQYATSTTHYSLSIAAADYNSFEGNVDYYADVKLTINTV